MTTETLSKTKRIWGIHYEEIFSDDYLIWRLFIKRPFKKNDYWWIGIGEKLLQRARAEGVNQFILVVGQREIPMNIPRVKDQRKKEVAGEYEIRESLFDGLPPMKIYHFKI